MRHLQALACLCLSWGLAAAVRLSTERRAPELIRAAVVQGGNPSPCIFTGFLTDCDAHLERIQVAQVRKPDPKRGQALVKIMAGSINAHDWEDLVMFGRSHFRTRGLDLAGVVEAVGEACSWKPGDEVWGTGLDNADAEYGVFRCGMLGRKPSNLTFIDAAALPIVATTGMGALARAGAPWNAKDPARPGGPTVLVLGGAGGSGSAGVQLAKALGAGKVITTCGSSNLDLAKSLGADQAIDYHKANWWDVLGKGSVDVIYDCVMQDGTGEHAYEVLRDGGRLVSLLPNSLANSSLARQRPSVKQTFYLNLMDKSTRDLDRLREMVERGQLRPVVDSVYGLGKVQEAFRRSMGRHMSGKIIIRMDD